MPQDNATLLDFLRHGEPVGGSRYRGNGIDDPLSESGWQQLHDTTSAIHGWQRIISSPMQRCLRFAQWLAEQRDLPLQVIDDLKEVGFGDWEGLSRKDVRLERPEQYHAFYRDPVNNRPPKAESLANFTARVSAVFDHLLAVHRGQHLLIVAHAGVIRATLCHVAGLPTHDWYHTAVDYAGLTRYSQDQHGLRLDAHNWRPAL